MGQLDRARVKLPRKVADALVRTRSAHSTWNSHDLCYIILNERGYCQYENEPDIKTLHEWSNTNELKFANALMSGYEVEQTSEEKAIEWIIERNCIKNGFSAHDVVMAIKSILNGSQCQ